MTDKSDDSVKETTQRAAPPSTLRGAVAVWLALAGFELLTIGASWAGRSKLRETAVQQGLVSPDKADAAIQRLLLQNTVVFGLFCAAFVVFGILLYKAKAWARIALVVVAAFQLLLLFSGAVSQVSVLILGMAISGAVLSWLPASSRWLAQTRAGTDSTGEH